MEHQLVRLQLTWAEIGGILKGMEPGADEKRLCKLMAQHWARFWANPCPRNNSWQKEFLLGLKDTGTTSRMVEAIVLPSGELECVVTSKVFEEPAAAEEKGEEEAGALGFKSAKALKKSLKKLASSYVFSNLDCISPLC